VQTEHLLAIGDAPVTELRLTAGMYTFPGPTLPVTQHGNAAPDQTVDVGPLDALLKPLRGKIARGIDSLGSELLTQSGRAAFVFLGVFPDSSTNVLRPDSRLRSRRRKGVFQTLGKDLFTAEHAEDAERKRSR